MALAPHFKLHHAAANQIIKTEVLSISGPIVQVSSVPAVSSLLSPHLFAQAHRPFAGANEKCLTHHVNLAVVPQFM